MGSTSKPEIVLIPWDPSSPSHQERLYQQRLACTWDEDKISLWAELQLAGKTAIQWITLSPSDPEKDSKLASHIKAYPAEVSPLTDTASTFGGKPRDPSPSTEFIPIGHISLNAGIDDLGVEQADAYKISTFFVSSALQGGGIGRAAMDAVESMATSEPLNAKTLLLNTTANDGVRDKAKYAACGIELPVHTNQDWYARRGYEVYGRKEDMWSRTDKNGKLWWWPAVFMRKDIK